MTRRLLFAILALGLVAFLALNVRITYAAPRAVAAYEVFWWTVDGGGAQQLTGGVYTLSGTIGQPDAGAQSGGAYSLGGGFWTVDVFGFKINLPLIQRD